MNRPPRDPQQPLFDHRTLLLSFLQGASVLAIALAVFAIAHLRGEPETNTRALTFTTFIIANLTLILANRSWTRLIVATLRSPNPALWWVIGGALAVLALVLYVPFARDLFRFSRLHKMDLVICSIAGVFSVLWFEALKIFLNGEKGGSYAEVGSKLGMSESAVKVTVHRLRLRYRELLRLEIANTVSGPEAIKDEIGNLFAALS